MSSVYRIISCTIVLFSIALFLPKADLRFLMLEMCSLFCCLFHFSNLHYFYATILKHKLVTFTPENEKSSKIFQIKSQLYRYVMHKIFPQKTVNTVVKRILKILIIYEIIRTCRQTLSGIFFLYNIYDDKII